MNSRADWQDVLASAVGSPLTSAVIAEAETCIDLPPERLLAAVSALRERWPELHLTAITGQWVGGRIELLCHLLLDGGLTLRVRVEDGPARLPSLAPTWPAADWYEREAHDLLGIEFVGHPNLAPLLLSLDWDSPPPLLPTEDRP